MCGIARRKAIYEALYPDTKHGANQHTRSGQVDNSSQPSFADSTAEATGRSRESVNRDAKRGSSVCQQARDIIRGTKADTGVFLENFCKHHDEATRLLRGVVPAAKDEHKRPGNQNASRDYNAPDNVRRDSKYGNSSEGTRLLRGVVPKAKAHGGTGANQYSTRDCNSHIVRTAKPGENNPDRTLARLKRDRPDLAEQGSSSDCSRHYSPGCAPRTRAHGAPR